MLRRLLDRDRGQDGEGPGEAPVEQGGAGCLPRLLDVAQVADATGIAEWRLYELVAAEAIPCVRIGRRVLFHPTRLNEWLLAGGTAAPDPEAEP